MSGGQTPFNSSQQGLINDFNIEFRNGKLRDPSPVKALTDSALDATSPTNMPSIPLVQDIVMAGEEEDLSVFRATVEQSLPMTIPHLQRLLELIVGAD
jgi:hypothetical protein